jgi:1,4-dihydroxy-2-naphthoate octaprenyltransferase
MTNDMTGAPDTSRPAASRRGLLFWLRAARAPFFTGSFAPVLVGVAFAFYESGALNWLRAVLTLVALVLLHAGANLANDYFDHFSGGDEINVSRAPPFTGGSRFIQDGLARPSEILAASVISLGLGGAAGLYLVWVAGLPILILGIVGAGTGFCYSAPPLKLGYRGLGELFIFLDFGVLPVVGAHYAQTEVLSAGAAVAGAVVGLLMTNVLWINQFQDAEADAAVGKRNWVVRLGRRSASLVHAAIFAAAYLTVVGGVALGRLPVWSALALLSLPLALVSALVSRRNYDTLERLLPANITTVAVHLVTSVLLALGLILAGWLGHS